MVGASKILTVSYGTFSCTLEGFDDSFGTMKAIAEYFRDLAADDRYFGAEPPTPDAEMLQRIAEREIRKRVEARIGEEGIVLRPERAKAELPAAPPEQPAEPVAERPEAPEAEAPAAEAPAERPEAEAPAQPAPPDSVAAKLARIRAVVDHARTAAPALQGYVEDEEPEPQVAESTAGPLEAEEEAGFAEPRRAPEPEGVEEAALLDAISRKLSPAPEAVEAAEEEMAAQEEERAAREAEEVFETSVDFEEEAELSVSIEEEVAPVAEAEEEPREGPSAEESEAEARAEAKVVPPTRETDAEAAHGAAARARARVLKIKRADLEAVPAPAAAEQPAEAEELADLSPEEEAELMAELAEVEREAEHAPRRPGRDRLQSSEMEQEERTFSRLIETTNTKLEGSEHRRRRTAIAHLKAAVAATVAERRLSHGRDAKAEEAAEMAPYRQDLAKVVRPSRPEPQGAPEGKKLAPLMLVSEQRIDTPSAPPSAPAHPRHVASGNLALQPHEEEEPETSDIAEADSRFAEYAEQHAAQDLAELLEAAGAFMADVEGLESFSRPQAMRLVDQARGGAFSREDRLRAFGRLLREGKFERIKRGRFAISDSSRFRTAQNG